MKKYFSLMAIAAAVMLGFASCSDDEGSTNPTTPGGSTMADNVAGIYDSQIAVSINGNDLQPSNYAVEITKSSDTEIKFTLRDFSITDPSGMTLDLGTITRRCGDSKSRQCLFVCNSRHSVTCHLRR